MSIKAKLLIFTLSISLIPISIITTVYYLNSRSVLKNQKLQELIAIVEAKRIHIMSFMEAKEGRTIDFSSDGFTRNRLEIITRKGTQSYDISSLNRHLKVNKTPLDNHIASIAVLDISGKVVASTTEQWIGRDMSDDDIFQECKSKNYGETYTGKSYCVPYINVNCLFISAPLINIQGNKTIGVIINAYDLDSLNEITTNRIGMGETGEVYIVNKDKIMITESRFIENTVLNRVVDTEPVRKIVESGSDMSGIYADYRGVPIVGASANIPEYGWILLAEVDKTEAFANVVRMRIFTIIMGCISVIVVITTSIILSKSVTKPIHNLVEGTRRIANGDLAFRIETPMKDEIGQLATSFNDMTFQLGESKKQLHDYTLNLEEKVEDKTKETKRSKEYIDNLIETAHDAIVSDENQVITGWNKSAERIFGYSKREIIGQPITTLIPEKHRKEHDKGVERYLKTGEAKIIGKTTELSGITKEGIEIPLEISLTHQKLGNERHLFTAIIRNITERKEAQEILQKSESRYRDVAISMSDWIWEVDAQGKYTYVSGSVKKLLGYDQKKLLGLTPFTLMPPDEAERVAKIFTKISANKRPIVDLENWNTTKDGREVCLLTNGVPVLDDKGRLLGYRGVDKDITERKRAIKTLQQSEEKYRTLVHAIPDIIYKIDADGHFTFLNNAVRSLGYKPKELIGKHFSKILHPDDVKSFSRTVVFQKYLGKLTGDKDAPKLFDERRGQKRMTRNLEVRIVPKDHDKEESDVKKRKIGLITSFGEITATEHYHDKVDYKSRRFRGTVGIIIDITEKIKLQAEMMRASQLALIGELSAGLAHEINNPINGIINCAQLIMDECNKNPRLYKFSKIIIEESKRIATLTENLLFLSRRTVGHKSHVQIYEALYNSLSLMMIQLNKDNIIVKFNISKDIIAIYGSFQEIQQVFLNLIQNARYALNEKDPGKYMGKTLEISCKKVLIDDYQYVRIIFYDRGIGIPKNILSKITNPFFTTKSTARGTGLGLSICQRIIENHSGKMAIESVQGEFTKVIINLPVTK